MNDELLSKVKQRQFYIITIVWGDVYTDLFLKFSLPTQLAEGNLPVFRYAKKSIYAIYTTSKDAETIKKSPIYSVLSSILSVEIALIDDIDRSQHKMMAWNECHKRAIWAGNREDNSLIFMPPDSIWSEGSFMNLVKVINSEKKVIMFNVLDVTTETFVPAFLQEFTPNSDLSISVPARKLVKLTLENAHPLYEAWTWNSTKYRFPPYRSSLYWRVNKEGLLGRGFHIHPVLVKPDIRDAVPIHAIDVDYVPRACPHPKEIYVVEDSDEIMLCGLRFYNQNIEDIKQNDSNTRKTAIQVANWAASTPGSSYYSHLLYIFKAKTRIHAGNLTVEWEKIEKEADLIFKRIELWYLLLLPYYQMKFKLWIVSVYIKKAILIIRGKEKIQETRLYQKLVNIQKG